MLRYALRRALWMLPTLVGITLIAFGFLSAMPARPDASSDSEHLDNLPVFINAHPRDARSIAEACVGAIARDDHAASAREQLARLGGAALPFVLPRLDALAPNERARVALALEPVAQRMGLMRTDHFRDGEDAVLFWQQFWEERAVDFKSSVVRRAVRRLGAYGSEARHTELVELDTFALDEIMVALDEVRTTDDVARVSRLLSVAAHVSGRDDRLAPGVATHEAARCVVRWRQWWLDTRTDYVVLAGPGRLAAMVLETRYGHWALSAGDLRLGVGPDGSPVLDTLARHGTFTLLLSLAAQLIAYVFAASVGLLGAYRRASAPDRIMAVAWATAYSMTPLLACAGLAAAFGSRFALASSLLAICLGLVASPARQQRLASIDRLAGDCVRAARARGAGPWRLLFVHGWRLSAVTIASLAAIDFPAAFTGACVAERVFNLPGIGRDVTAAVAARNVPLLMAFGVCAAALTAFLLVAADVACARLDPRCRRTLLKEPG